VQPGPDGHFDHLDPDSREFCAAAMYATVRRVLDIWEDYFDRRIEWHFRLDYDRMELIPLVDWDNAQSGYGYLEFGYGLNASDEIDYNRPYCTNFDVLAHELGHSIVFAEVGEPDGAGTDEYGGFHESSGDLVAIVSSLHFHDVVDRLLTHSKGNLFSVNEMSRVGELSKTRQIRNAFNYDRLSTVTNEPHDLSTPLTGAIFDVFVEVYQKELVSEGLISQDLATKSYHAPGAGSGAKDIQKQFTKAYEKNPEGFKLALFRARDYLGGLLAGAWSRLNANRLTYHKIALALLDADRKVSGGKHQTLLRENFAWREIKIPTSARKPHRLMSCGIR
jgi:hypothetical protein